MLFDSIMAEQDVIKIYLTSETIEEYWENNKQNSVKMSANLEIWDKVIKDIETMESDRMSGDTPLVMKCEVLNIIKEYLKEQQ